VPAFRIVEAQHLISSRKLVNTDEEQAILESMIESIKPRPEIAQEAQGYHYLLFTPFRYPPLPYGSRFATQQACSLWYGSLQIETALAEKAYYWFVLTQASHAEFEDSKIELTAYSVDIQTLYGIDLSQAPFDVYTHVISSPTQYGASQQLGQSMRQDGVLAFVYYSARDKNLHGRNVGVFSLHAFKTKKPNQDSIETWYCWSQGKNQVSFLRKNVMQREPALSFSRAFFEVSGSLPEPVS